MTINRRDFIKTISATGLLSVLSGSMAARVAHAGSASRVIVIGGGFGGSICAKYIRLFSPSTAVTLIEPKKSFFTCPGSNSVIAGLHPMDYISHNYDALRAKYGVTVLHDWVSALDGDAKSLSLKSGKQLDYDILVISPGIDFKAAAIEGYSPEDASLPHGWQAGDQTRLLRDQIRAMADGASVIIAPPTRPFRAPPAPYERASLMAYYLQEYKPRSKVIILDGNDDFAKQTLFTEGWDKLYPGMIEWVGLKDHGGITRVDAKTREIITLSGNHFKGQVINMIPPQRAGRIAIESGLADASGWCPVNPLNFESSLQKNIHVIGDSCIAGDMPKTGHAANAQAKQCAAAIVAGLTGQALPEVHLSMSIYSLLSPKYGISMTENYRVKNNNITRVSSGSSPSGAKKKTRRKEAQYAEGWYKSITSDMFK